MTTPIRTCSRCGGTVENLGPVKIYAQNYLQAPAE